MTIYFRIPQGCYWAIKERIFGILQRKLGKLSCSYQNGSGRYLGASVLRVKGTEEESEINKMRREIFFNGSS